MSDLNEMGCDEFADAAAELALGVLTGRDRAKAIAHLDHCDACLENVRQLTMKGEELLGLLPTSEPSPGFGTGVMERFGLESPSPRRGPVSRIGRVRFPGRKSGGRPGPVRVGRTRRMLTVAAILLAGVVSGLGGWGLRVATLSPARSPLSSAALLTASRQTVGKIFFYDGTSRWIYMSVSMGPENGTVICQLETRDGNFITVGSFWLTDGYASWSSADPVNIGPLAGARLISTDGTVLAIASISGELGALRAGPLSHARLLSVYARCRRHPPASHMPRQPFKSGRCRRRLIPVAALAGRGGCRSGRSG